MDAPLRPTPAAVALAAGLILMSGNPVFSGSLAPLFLLVLLACGLMLPAPRHAPPFAARYIWIAGGFSLILASQWFVLGFVSWQACVYFLAKIFIGGLVIHRVGQAFPAAFFQATYLLSSICIVFYLLLMAVGPQDFPTLFPESVIGENLKSLLVFTAHNTAHYWRLSGAMWEPGAWQGILNLALLLMPARNILDRDHLHKTLVIVLSLILTFSTTGYVVLFLVILVKLLELRASVILRAFMAGALSLVALAVYQEADFLGEKIAQQAASTLFQEDFTPDRFGALIFDMQYIEKHPFIGNGFHESTRFADHPHLHGEPLGHGNGLSNFVASLGFLGLLVYCLGILRAPFAGGLGARLGLLFIVLLLCFGEPFFNFALFLGLPFLHGATHARLTSARGLRAPALASLS